MWLSKVKSKLRENFSLFKAAREPGFTAVILPSQMASPFSEHWVKKLLSLGACRISLISPFSLLIEEMSIHTLRYLKFLNYRASKVFLLLNFFTNSVNQ